MCTLLENGLPSLEIVSSREYREDDQVINHDIEDPVETRLSGWMILNLDIPRQLAAGLPRVPVVPLRYAVA